MSSEMPRPAFSVGDETFVIWPMSERYILDVAFYRHGEPVGCMRCEPFKVTHVRAESRPDGGWQIGYLTHGMREWTDESLLHGTRAAAEAAFTRSFYETKGRLLEKLSAVMAPEVRHE